MQRACREGAPSKGWLPRIALQGAVCLIGVVLPGFGSADPLPGAVERPPALSSQLAAASLPSMPRTRHLADDGTPLFRNRLLLETSPYLRQHAHNPVDWYPWGPEAFEAAARLGRPILLSIGYSTCHWCHVMERESFENLEIARYLNQHFIAIKVDREERPDIDAVYMAALQTLSGRGGWPANLFLTADRRAFYGGTYYPPEDDERTGRPGFLRVLQQIVRVHEEKQTELRDLAHSLGEDLERVLAPGNAHSATETAAGTGSAAESEAETAIGQAAPLGPETLEAVAEWARAGFDDEHGGLRQRQKFPSSYPIRLLLQIHRRTRDPELLSQIRHTLDAMHRGGLYDHVGGGFHRYSTEPSWTVPHFEKMLYDNALLARTYLDAWHATGNPTYADIVRDVLDYVAREMTAPEGTFYAATDADSEEEEGKFFVWTQTELREAVGPADAALAERAYGVTEEQPPNFEQRAYVLRRDASVSDLAGAFELSPELIRTRLAGIRTKLRAARAKREAPLRDDKQLVGWNGMMISAFARAGIAFADARLTERATRAAAALLSRARTGEGLARYLYTGEPVGTGLLSDHAWLIQALLDVFEATGEVRWIDAALELQTELDSRFLDPQGGGYFMTPSDGEALWVRHKPSADNARPSGNGIAANNLVRLARLTGRSELEARADALLGRFAAGVREAPWASPTLLEAVDHRFGEGREIVLVYGGERREAEPFLRQLAQVDLPHRVLVVAAQADVEELSARVPLLEGKRARAGKVTAYVCVDQVCTLPTSDVTTFAKQLERPARGFPARQAASSPTDG